MYEIKVPILPESVADATVSRILVNPGQTVQEGDILCELETDKVMLEVPSSRSGKIEEVHVKQNDSVKEGQLLIVINEMLVSDTSQSATTAAQACEDNTSDSQRHHSGVGVKDNQDSEDLSLCARSPSMRKKQHAQKSSAPEQEKTQKINKSESTSVVQANKETTRDIERVPLTRLRAQMAKKMHAAQQNTATLTTCNEVDFTEIIALRSKHREAFEKQHGVKLGYTAFVAQASCIALQRFPIINAILDGNEVEYHRYCDLGIAVASDRGLVVPVICDAHTMSLAELEQAIADCAQKVRSGKLSWEALQGGTFTITNGGVFGSMLSTPILNTPQSAILGMHSITQRAVVREQNICIRSMMYMALSYDHRLIDGRDAVQFLVTVKQLLEDPTQLILQR